MKVTRHLHIRGRVQGVYFRESMRHRARLLEVTGWVRNRADSSVEAVVQGEASNVEAIIAWARRGPEAALVTSLEIEDSAGDYPDFRTLPTL